MTEAKELAIVVGATGAFGQAIVDRLAAAGAGRGGRGAQCGFPRRAA